MATHYDKVPGERGLYLHNGVYYVRLRENGSDTHISLKCTKKAAAIKARDEFWADRRAVKLGLIQPAAPAPATPPVPTVTIRAILTRYLEDGNPDKRGNKRKAGDHLRQEKASLQLLDAYFGEDAWDSLTQNRLDEYHDHRVAQVNPDENEDQWKQGHRCVDLELNTLSNALTWAVRKELIKYNPIFSRIKYHQPSKARHAKDVCPQSPEELHDIFKVVFTSKRGESLAWQGLYEAMTGQRTSEAIALRMDAGPDEPGYIQGESIRVRRAEKADRENPHCHIHPALKKFLKAHKVWHKKRYPKSRWFFPGRDREADQSVCGDSLTRLLAKLFEEGKIKRKITGHGMRGHYVLHQRSWGIPDSQIAWEINQIGGVGTLQQSYGGVHPHWIDGKGPKLLWLPRKGKPAWEFIDYSKKASKSGL